MNKENVDTLGQQMIDAYSVVQEERRALRDAINAFEEAKQRFIDAQDAARALRLE